MVISIQKLILDFDLTIVNSIKKIVELYDTDFNLYKNYKKVHWTNINTYSFDELTLINRDIVLDYFDDHRFFYKLEYMDNAKEVLDKLKNKYELIVCSMGRQMNLYYKKEWLNNNLPYIKFEGVDLNHGNKQSIDMSGAIILDDNIDNLHNCNADVKLIFGDKYPWNSNNPNMYHRCWNWIEVEKLLLI
jgi:5'(3')-deoxyribonucleotidase